MAKKSRSDAKLKHLPAEAQEELWDLVTKPQVPMSEEEGAPLRPYTLQELQAEVPLRHGFTVALSTLSEWRAWYSQRLRTENAMARADQARLEWLKENPEATPEELQRLGQMVFTSESISDGNVKAFVMLMRERNRAKKIELDSRRVKLLEEKAARLDEAKKDLEERKEGGGLSEETLELIERTLGML